MTIFPLIWLILAAVAALALAVLRPERHIVWLVIILLMTAGAVWVSLPDNPGIHVDFNNDGVNEIDKTIAIRQGLDLAGGVQVLLEADLPEGEEPEAGAMDEARRIIEDRIDALGTLEPVVQLSGSRRLIVELPGYSDPETAIELIQETALLEFVEMPSSPPEVGTRVYTDYQQSGTGAAQTPPEGETIYHTVITGEALEFANVVVRGTQSNPAPHPMIEFGLKPDAVSSFGAYTSTHVGQVLGIVLDGEVISAPRISTAITTGSGVIEGRFELAEAERLATQLRYGALPVPLRVQSTNTVGPTLGQISVQQSIRAGIIGISVVLLFMLIYYRVPGIAAALALLVFAVLNFAIYKLFPEYFTMTLPAITGFLISVGTAVDGNILIFERMKEELRAGKKLGLAVDAGFDRAWTSIRDSNLSTIIICGILAFFGSSFGAGAVRGFAFTLALGLVINLFTAVTVTRTFLHFILLPRGLAERHWLLGL